MGLSLARDVEPRRQQPLMRAEASGDGVGIAGGGDHRIACGGARLPRSERQNPGKLL